jgi:hypothetical protein
MKIRLVTLAALAAITFAPIVSQASDKEVKKCHYKTHHQVALFVSGRSIGQNNPAPSMQTVTQVGQGAPVTFFTGNR